MARHAREYRRQRRYWRRLRKVARSQKSEGIFSMTYGDGVSDLDISATIDFHRSHGKQVIVTAVQPPIRFGGLGIVCSSPQCVCFVQLSGRNPAHCRSQKS
jgi:NDP-sugar pyrophosphorylase family protein